MDYEFPWKRSEREMRDGLGVVESKMLRSIERVQDMVDRERQIISAQTDQLQSNLHIIGQNRGDIKLVEKTAIEIRTEISTSQKMRFVKDSEIRCLIDQNEKQLVRDLAMFKHSIMTWFIICCTLSGFVSSIITTFALLGF